MDTAKYGRIAGRLHAGAGDAVFAEEGTTRSDWEAAWAELGPRMAASQELSAAYAAAFRAGLQAEVGAVRTLTEQEYVDAEVARRLGRPADTAELSAAQFLVGQYAWLDELTASTRATLRMEARVVLALHAAQGRYEIRPLPPPRLARRVRQRRCPFCAAVKATVARTPTVYCDFCGGLMGYDYEAARVVTHGLDPSFVTLLLVDGVRAELRASFGVDDDAWAAAWRWVYRTDIELCPEGWTPRVRQPDFRDAIVEWSVQTCRVANVPRVKAARVRAREAFDVAVARVAEGGGRPSIERHLRLADRALEAEIALFEERDLFGAHPEGLTPDVYRCVYRGGLVDQWRPWLDPERLAVVRAHVDASEAWMDVPPVELHRSTCGGCGGALAVVAGAQALVCEACGRRLDAERPRFPCPNCSAAVVVVPDTHEITCGHCSAVFLPG